MPRKPLPLETFNWSGVKINSNHIEKLAKCLSSYIHFDKEYELKLLLNLIRCCDITTLSGDDSISNVRRLACKAQHPLSQYTLDLIKNNGEFNHLVDFADNLTSGAVCVYPNQVDCVRRNLDDKTTVQIASVATGFPSGQYPISTKLEEIRFCASKGANEIDVVVSRDLIFQGRWQELYEEQSKIAELCSQLNVKLKVILETGQLANYQTIYRSSWVCMLAGADTIKTSTGKESVLNATLPVLVVMMRAIRDFHRVTGCLVGLKPAGGVKSAKEALSLAILVDRILSGYNKSNESYLQPKLFRIGCSSLLSNLELRIIQLCCGEDIQSSQVSVNMITA